MRMRLRRTLIMKRVKGKEMILKKWKKTFKRSLKRKIQYPTLNLMIQN